ncbi:MAG: adenylate/guanylate cyclase domain-containing protein [Myxococcota bacterium]|nr:adenylate/guanylate cyclase domain-containing protein [Myxococcota bacterium]
MATRTRTVLFTDMANYTATVSRADRQELRNLLAAHEKFVHPILTRRGGRIVKSLGDAYMALFDSATDAARAGLDVVEKVASTGTLIIRVSCATGDVEEIDGDAFGDAVNLAARINSKTPAGEFWFSESTRICMNQSELPFESVGVFTLKGLVGSTACYRAVGRTRCWLPQQVISAVKGNTLVRIQKGDPQPSLPPDPIVLLEGFRPGSEALSRAVDSLPVLDPNRLFLSAYHIAPADRFAWQEAGHGLVMGTPDALASAIAEVRAAVTKPSGSNTIILDMGQSSELDLVMSGLALPAVPMAEVVAGYTYDLLPDGRWVNRSDRAVLRVDVSRDGVRMGPLQHGIAVDGRSLPPGASVALQHGATIMTPSGRVTFYRLENGPYAGLMVSDSPLRMGVGIGQVTELGREPNHPGLALPDRRGQDNIRWCSGSRAARARQGGFTLDRALAGRRQAAVEVGPQGNATLRSLHERCPTYIYSEGTPLRRVDPIAPVQQGDFVVTGTSVVALRPPQD